MAKFDAESKLWHGSSTPGVLNPRANLGQVILNLLSRSPDRVIQINADDGSEMTCAEMRRRIVRVALNLKHLGHRRGELVSLVCTNSENVVPVFFGCVAIGLTVNPLAPVFNKDDLAHMMRQTQSSVVFCDETNYAVVEQAVRLAIVEPPEVFIMGAGRGIAKSIDELLRPAEGEDDYLPEYLGDSESLLAMVLCSSGTTGSPKGVCLSHAHLIDGEVFSNDINVGPIFNFSPLFWATGTLAMLTSLYNTRARVITTQPFSVALLISIIERYKVEDVFMPPTQASILVAHPRFSSANFASIKRWTLGGAAVPEDLRLNLASRIPNGSITPIYGSSENGFITSAIEPCAPGSVGTLVNHVSARIVDESGRSLGPGEVGEIHIKCKHKALGYLHNEEATRNAFDEDNFFKTGDIGYFDKNGFLYVIDRIKDIIKYKGFQISPSDLEAIIGKIDGVQQVCVAGLPSTDLTYDLATAMVVRRQGSSLSEEQVVSIVDSQVGDHKKLRGGVCFVDQLPTSASGKVLRLVVARMLKDMKQTK